MECDRFLHITLLICPYIALSVKRKSDGDSMLFKHYWGSIKRWCTCACLNLIIINIQSFPIVLRLTEAFDVLIFFKKRFCLMSVLKFTFLEVASLLGDNLAWYFFYIKYFRSVFPEYLLRYSILRAANKAKQSSKESRCDTA